MFYTGSRLRKEGASKASLSVEGGWKWSRNSSRGFWTTLIQMHAQVTPTGCPPIGFPCRPLSIKQGESRSWNLWDAHPSHYVIKLAKIWIQCWLLMCRNRWINWNYASAWFGVVTPVICRPLGNNEKAEWDAERCRNSGNTKLELFF